MLSFLTKTTFISSFFLTNIFLFSLSVRADSTAIPANVAKTHTSNIFIAPGRIAVISFEDDEKITTIQTSDNHRIDYVTNLPLETGLATHIAIHQIQALPNLQATVNPIPNLIVFTTNADKSYHAAYEFNLHLNSPNNRGVRIVQTSLEARVTLNTKFGVAHPRDIQNGFDLALSQGKIHADDTHKIRTFLVLIRNGISIDKAVSQTNVSLEVIDILATNATDLRRNLLCGKGAGRPEQGD